MNVQEEVDALARQIASKKSQIEWLERHRAKLESLPPASINEFIGARLDFDDLSHDRVIEVIKAFGGKWEKSISARSGDRIDYRTVFDGFAVRCYAGEPPPACKIVEVEEYVPASVQKVRKLVCPDSIAETNVQFKQMPAIEAESSAA
jgi:hypothetical protein